MQLTIRGVPARLEKAIRTLAETEGISLSKAALKLLVKGAGLGRKKKTTIGSDLDHLFGTWGESAAEEFRESIRSCDQIDEDFWK